MPRRFDLHPELAGDQQLASHPRELASLSASAGTGKTHVLTARVLRLLLDGVEPSSILCLTFTKSGAAEMSHRIHARLASWVRARDQDLRKELERLCHPRGGGDLDHARNRFASVLESTGGGLRVMTIHAFAQSLLGAFPAEAGLAPGFRPIEEREAKGLLRSTLADFLAEAEHAGDLGLRDDVRRLSLRLGEGGVEDYLGACAAAPDSLAALGPREGIEPRLRAALGLPLGGVAESVAQSCCDDLFDLDLLARLTAANQAWGTSTAAETCERIALWLAREPAERAETIGDLGLVSLTKEGGLRKVYPGQIAADPEYEALAARLALCCAELIRLRKLDALVPMLAAGLRAGQAYARAYGDAKRAAGFVDFNDLIAMAERLLGEPGIGDWVRYKLDQRIDHILVDEAQDTNDRQWAIVAALAEEYFAGEGASSSRRTLFSVGDFKQAIFGFQGTDPRSFEAALVRFTAAARGVERELHLLSVNKSFRSSPPILEVVDALLAGPCAGRLGLPEPPFRHETRWADRGGAVTLWRPFTYEPEPEAEEAGDENWLGAGVRQYAGSLARQIRALLDAPFRLECRKGRALRPEDILILVRRRSDLAALIVARLHQQGVRVAGVDRLRLSAPLAVRDLLAAARFAVQPLDDLNLAALLVSPLLGWSQDDLLRAAAGRRGALWPRLREPGVAPPETLEALQAMLRMADFAPPFLFFETLLSGSLDGRRKLLHRLGSEARDPIEELLSAALQFESSGQVSLESFLDWFSRDDVDIVRDPSGPLDAVRVMTVHGAKGLQAPVVILADACVDPNRMGGRHRPAALPLGGLDVPILRPRKDELVEPLRGPIADQQAREREEHWRLLYVGLTRAEERLFVGGALSASANSGPPAESWYRAVGEAMAMVGAAPEESPIWGGGLCHGTPPRPAASVPGPATGGVALPEWSARPAPVEERPPRPLAPSAIRVDDVALPPPGPELREAARRGRLLHRLFERLPPVDPGQRRERGDMWLEQAAGIEDPAVREALLADFFRVADDPRFAELFAPEALAEAPIAAVVADGVVVAGTVDRLLVEPDRVLVADFKTGRAPVSAEAAPPAHLRQMAAYRAALRAIFPGRRVESALLYSATPVLLALPDALLDAHAPGRDAAAA